MDHFERFPERGLAFIAVRMCSACDPKALKQSVCQVFVEPGPHRLGKHATTELHPRAFFFDSCPAPPPPPLSPG